MNKKINFRLIPIFLIFSFLAVNSLPAFAVSCLSGNCTPHTASYPIYSSSNYNPSYSATSHTSISSNPSSSCSGSNCTPHTTSYPIYSPTGSTCTSSHCTPHPTSYPIYTPSTTTTTTTTQPPVTTTTTQPPVTTTTTQPPVTTTTTQPPVTTTTTTTKPPCCHPPVVVVYPVQQVINPTLDFWADKYVLNLGESTYLRWSSSNVNYCVATLGWNGPKNTNGSELVSPDSDTSYSLTCYGNNGVITRNLTIKVIPPSYATTLGEITLSKSARNLSQGERSYSKNVLVKYSDIVEFYITIVNNSSIVLNNVVVKDILPSVLSYRANTTKVNGILYPDGISQNGLNIGNLNVGETKTITFQALALANTGTYTNFVQITGSNFVPKTDSMSLVFPAIIDASTVKTGSIDGATLSILTSSLSSSGIFYFLKFTEKGQMTLTRFEERLRKYSLEKERKRMLRK